MLPFPIILVHAEEDDQKNSSTDLKPVVPIEESGDDNMPPDICLKVKPDTSVDHALDNKHKATKAGCGHMFEAGSNSLLESLHIAEECGSHSENAGGPCVEAVKNKMHDNSPMMGSGAKVSMKSAERGTFDGIGKKSISTMHSDLCKVAEGVSVSRNDGMRNTYAAANPATLSPYSKKPLYEAVLLKANELEPNPSNYKRMFKSETPNSCEEVGQSSPIRKRKKTSDTGDSNGCKRCNCKKTNCLKRYCDCFAAGMYCAEACACEGCFNRVEYKDSVDKRRKEIEIQKPLAFAPKILQRTTEPPTNICVEDAGHFTPSSTTREIACNCKKSKCLKKYCECYQANVGCSDGCRCEACENVYGQKRVSSICDTVQALDKQNMRKGLANASLPSTSGTSSEHKRERIPLVEHQVEKQAKAPNVSEVPLAEGDVLGMEVETRFAPVVASSSGVPPLSRAGMSSSLTPPRDPCSNNVYKHRWEVYNDSSIPDDRVPKQLINAMVLPADVASREGLLQGNGYPHVSSGDVKHGYHYLAQFCDHYARIAQAHLLQADRLLEAGAAKDRLEEELQKLKVKNLALEAEVELLKKGQEDSTQKMEKALNEMKKKLEYFEEQAKKKMEKFMESYDLLPLLATAVEDFKKSKEYIAAMVAVGSDHYTLGYQDAVKKIGEAHPDWDLAKFMVVDKETLAPAGDKGSPAGSIAEA